MEKMYQILLIEDDQSDTELIKVELGKLDIDVQLDIIQKEEQLVDRLENNPPDLVISDYSLPTLSGTKALNIVREQYSQLPFILVTKASGEEKAVDTMLKGANDYVIKENLDRLGPAVLREIANYEEYKKQSRRLEETRSRYENLVKSVNGIVWEADAETFEFKYVSPQSEHLLGFTPDEWLREPNFWQDHIHPDDRKKAINFCHYKTQQGEDHSFEYRMFNANDEVVWLRDYVTVIMENGEPDRLRGLMVDISKEKKIERQRDKAYEIANIGHWELDLMNKNLYWSNAIKKLHEVGPDYEPDLDTALEFYKEGEHRQKITKAVESAIERGESFEVELKIITPNDNEKWVRAVGETEFHDGECIRIYGSAQDITQRKEVEQKLRDVVEHSTNMFYRHDTNHVLSYLSPQAEDFLGCSPEEAKEHWAEFATDHPVNEKGYEYTQRAIDTGEKQPSFSLQLQKKNGEKIWVRVNEAPINENGETIAIVGSLTDITEQKKYEEQLQESLERYDYVTKATSDAIWDWDLTEDTVYWGKGFETLFGYNLSNLANDSSSWTNHIHPDDKEWVYDSIKKTIDGNKQNWFEEYRYLKADGSHAFVEDRGFVIRDEDGKAIRMIGAMRDVTDQKELVIQKNLQQNVSQFFKKAESLDNILADVLEHLADFGNFSTAEIWLAGKNHKRQHLKSIYAKDKKGQKFYESSNITSFAKGEGLPGVVWESEEMHIWNNIETKSTFIRQESAQNSGLKAAVGIPLFHNENFVGSLLLGSDHLIESSRNKISFYEGLQKYLGAEIQRKQQEEELRLLFESAPDIIAIASPNGRFVTVNPTFCEIMGYSEEELTTKPFEEFIHPDDIKTTQNEYKETITGERKADNFVNRYRTKSGEYRWLSWSSSEVFGEEGFVFAFGRDVTEQKELEKLLQKTNRLAQIGSWELDLSDDNNDKMYWSEMTREIIEVDDEYNPTLTRGFEFFEPESKERIQNAVDKAINKGIPFDEELLITTAKGNKRWIRSIGQTDFIDGECRRLYGSFQNIHKRKEAELKMKEAFQEREKILDRINEAFFAIDQNWNVTYWNRQAEKVIGVTRDEVLGKNLWEKFPEAKERKFFKEYKRALQEQVSVQFEEYYPPLDRWLELNAYPSEEGLSVFFRDITERKQHEKELQESVKERESLLMGIHHRVKNNLAVVSGMMQLQAFNEEDESLKDKLFDSVVRIKTMASIHELLYQSNSYSNLQLGQNIKKLVSNVMESYQIDSNIAINFNIESVVVNINQAIPCSLIVNEVVTNVYKHAFDKSQKGELSVEVTEKNKNVYIRIKDNGKGLPEDFEKISKSNSLGLKLIDTLTAQLDGEYVYESLDQGTLFTLTFEKADNKGIGNARLI
jgi:PAS domain S-box-containing protein